MKRTFSMNGKTYESMMDIAREIGIKRVYPRDFDKYGVVETTGQDVAETSKDVPVAKTEEPKEVEKEEKKVSTPEPKPEKKSKSKADKVDAEMTAKEDAGEAAVDVDDLVSKVPEMSIIQFNDIIGKWDVDSLVKLAEKAGVNLWDKITNASIRKMRLLMEIKKFYYPNDKVPVKPDSVWKNIPLESLIKLADEKSLEYRKSDESKIQRMWVIKALNDAGVSPDEVKTDEVAATDAAES